MDTGEARIAVDIAGNEVVGAGRFVHVPEEWERAFRNRRGVTRIVQISSVVLVVLLYVAGAVLAVVRWSRHRFAAGTFAIFFAFLAAVGAIQLLNSLRTATAQFVTAQPFKLQFTILVIGGLLAMTVIAAVSALLIGLSHRMLPEQPQAPGGASISAGFGLGAVLAATGAVGLLMAPQSMPAWPNLFPAGDSLPVFGAVLGSLSSWITGTALFLLAVAVLHALTAGWQKLRAVAAVCVVLFGLVVTASEGVESLPLWLLEGFLTGIVLLAVWVLVLRHHPALVPLVTACGTALGGLREAVVGAYPGATLGSVIGSAVVIAISVWWFRRLTVDSAFASTERKAIAVNVDEPQTEE